MRWLVALLLLTSAAYADVTKINYLQSTPSLHYVNMYDVNGNPLDVREGDLKQFGSDCYYYGESAQTGYIPNVDSPPQGFRVYRLPGCDPNNPEDHGPMFDVTREPVKTACAGSSAGSYKGCWRIKVLENLTTGKFVIIYEEYNSGTQAVQVWECDTPLPPCTNIGPMPSHAPGTSDDTAAFRDFQSNDAYLVFNNGVGGTVHIRKLTADYHDVTGSTTDSGFVGEAVWMQHVGSKWMLGGGTNCANCAPGSTPSYVWATAWNGTYGGTTQLGPANGCSSQLTTIALINSGYYYIGDRFSGDANLGQSAPYWQPLTVTSDLFDQFSCHASVTITGTTSAGTYPTPAYSRNFDVNFFQYLNSDFYDDCRIGTTLGNVAIAQQFVPTVAPLNAIAIIIGKCRPFGDGAPDGSLKVSIKTVSSGNPGTTVGSVTYTAASLPWGGHMTIVPLGLTLTPSTTYYLEVEEIGNTQGAFVVARAQPGSALYGSNLAKYTTDGTTWNTLTNEMMLVSTIPLVDAAVVPFSGVAH